MNLSYIMIPVNVLTMDFDNQCWCVECAEERGDFDVDFSDTESEDISMDVDEFEILNNPDDFFIIPASPPTPPPLPNHLPVVPYIFKRLWLFPMEQSGENSDSESDDTVIYRSDDTVFDRIDDKYIDLYIPTRSERRQKSNVKKTKKQYKENVLNRKWCQETSSHDSNKVTFSQFKRDKRFIKKIKQDKCMKRPREQPILLTQMRDFNQANGIGEFAEIESFNEQYWEDYICNMDYWSDYDYDHDDYMYTGWPDVFGYGSTRYSCTETPSRPSPPRIVIPSAWDKPILNNSKFINCCA